MSPNEKRNSNDTYHHHHHHHQQQSQPPPSPHSPQQYQQVQQHNNNNHHHQQPPQSPHHQSQHHHSHNQQHNNNNNAMVTKERRVTSPGVLIGSAAYEDDDEDDDPISQIMNRPSDEITPRPISAYVDLSQSYIPAGSRDSRDMSLHDNPMKSEPSPYRREKAITVHSSSPSDTRQLAPTRRPSPTDMKNLEEFKKGRSSKRAAGKTQV